MENKKSKQVLVIRKDLRNTEGQKIRTGKIIAQACHASMKFILDNGAYYQAELDHPEQFHSNITQPCVKAWINGLFTKVCVSVDSEQELLTLYNQAKDAGLIASLITDAGLTEFGGVPTNTCIAIGPAWEDDVDGITGHLKLL
jgi:PTH2 family peptidyl-tRNA hydrolase